MTERIAYSPKEFAALFGKEQTWAYRLIYAEKIKIISQFGNKLIPASEVERLLESANLHGESKKSSRGRRRHKARSMEKRSWVNHMRRRDLLKTKVSSGCIPRCFSRPQTKFKQVRCFGTSRRKN